MRTRSATTSMSSIKRTWTRCVVRIKLKHPLAFNLEGDAVRIPRNAWAWRVRRVENGSLAHRRGGQCTIVRAADGGPLHMALGSSLADLSAQLACRGLYRLD